MSSKSSPQDAAAAAMRILGCFPEIPASDKQVFISGLVEMLTLFPKPVVDLASSPAQGIPSKLKFLSLADIRALLDAWGIEHADRERRIATARPLLRESISFDRPEPQPGDLANTFVPAGHIRYPRLVEWAKSADPRLWRFGKSSDGRDGIWISWNIWDSGTTSPGAPTLGKVAAPTIEELKKIYAKPALSAADEEFSDEVLE